MSSPWLPAAGMTCIALAGCSGFTRTIELKPVERLSKTESAVVTWISNVQIFWPDENVQARLDIPYRLNGPFAASPSGQYVLSTDRDIDAPLQTQSVTYVTDLHTGRSRAIYRSPFMEPTVAAAWSEDGGSCYFVKVTNQRAEHRIHDEPTSHVFRYDVLNDTCCPVVSVIGYAFTTLRSSARQMLAARALQPDGKRGFVCIIDLNSATYVVLNETLGLSHDFDVTGSYFFFDSNNGQRDILKSLEVSSRRTETIMTGSDTWSFRAAWSPDGRIIAMMYGREFSIYDTKNESLCRVEWITRNWHQTGICTNPVWSRTGRYLAGYWGTAFYVGSGGFTRGGGGGIQYHLFVADMERKEVVQLGTAEHPRPIYFIEDPVSLARLKEAWWVKESMKDPRGGNPPKAIIEK